jgi:hypothetical protein
MALEWVGTLGTAIVGIVGIMATYWAAAKARITQNKNLQLSINAENERARLAEKRRVYTAYMSAIGSYVLAERTLADAREKGLGKARVLELRSDLSRSMTVMLAALCEIRLIAPGNLTALAVSVVQQLTLSEDTSLRFPEFRDELYTVMRLDLGEPEHQAIEVPEIVTHALQR